MTICYTDKVATCRGIGNFYKMLFRWKGSIYKVLWVEIITYLICYYLIHAFYRFYLVDNCDQKMLFKELVKYCDTSGKVIPITFVLGFYVSTVVRRWWNQFMFLPWPDTLALTVSATVDGSDDRGRLIRRTLLRYANICFVQAMCYVSVDGPIRFPTTRHLVEAGLLLEHERLLLEEVSSKTIGFTYWVPIIWAGVVARRARKEGQIKDDISLNNVISALNTFRRQTQEMINYDWVNVPLVYTQVVTLAVYMYFLTALVGKQVAFVETTDGEIELDLYVPVFTFLEFFFYFGWLKVAECLINPYGQDDDDFEVNWLIDRDFEVAYVIVDEMHQEHPNLLKDQYWDEIFPNELPYTEATAKYRHAEGQVGSTRNIEVKKSEANFINSNHDMKPVAWDDKTSEKSIHEVGSASSDHDPHKRRGSLVSEFARRRVSLASNHLFTKSAQSIGSSTSGSGRHKKNHLHKRVIGSSGYWGETGKSNEAINISELMEKDDVQYDPAADDSKSDKQD